DADPARHRGVPRAALRRDHLHDLRPRNARGQHRLRQLLPALPTLSLRRPRGARARRVQRWHHERRLVGRPGSPRGKAARRRPDPRGAGQRRAVDRGGRLPVLWHSYNSGATWSSPVPFDTGPQDAATAGGDADTVVAPNGNVIVADLNLTYAWIQVSADHGQT